MHVNLYVLCVCDGIWPVCDCVRVTSLMKCMKETKRDENWTEEKKKTEYIVGSRTLYAKAWNIIRCESLWPRATLPLFRSFDSYTFARPGRSNEPKHNFFFTRCICMQKCFLYSLSQRFFFFFLRRSCTSNTHTLKLSSIACENSISLCLWLFFLLFEYDHYSAYVMYVCARIIIINVDWVLFLFLLQIMSFNHHLSSMVSKMNCRFQLH